MPKALAKRNPKMIKRLNATLPPKLAEFVSMIIGETGLYETPSEFVRDLIRRYMESTYTIERHEINHLLRKSVRENSHTPLTKQDAIDVRNAIRE